MQARPGRLGYAHPSSDTRFKGPFTLAPNANARCLEWRVLAIATVIGDAFAREFVAPEVGLHSTLASTLQRARATPNANAKIFFSNVKDPLSTRHGMKFSAHKAIHARNSSYSFHFQPVCSAFLDVPFVVLRLGVSTMNGSQKRELRRA